MTLSQKTAFRFGNAVFLFTLLLRQYHPLRHPIGEHRERLRRLGWVIGGQVNTEIMLAAHIAVHHKLHGEHGGFTRL